MRLRIASMIAVTAAVVSTSAVAADLPAKALLSMFRRRQFGIGADFMSAATLVLRLRATTVSATDVFGFSRAATVMPRLWAVVRSVLTISSRRTG